MVRPRQPVALERRRTATEAEVANALRALDLEPRRIPARDWPAGAFGIDLAGLYAWWTDAPGAKELSEGIGVGVEPGRIYAGLTGATKWPSGRVVRSSLRGRIGANHLRGTIRRSTFRRTLAAALRQPLGLELAAPGRLTPGDERELTSWMRTHLEVAIHPFAATDALADCERAAIATPIPRLQRQRFRNTSAAATCSTRP